MRTFYDIHTHAFDLSHPNLSVFLQRQDLIDGVVDSVMSFWVRLALPFVSLASKKFIKKTVQKQLAKSGFINQLNNTLAFFEIPIEYQFLVMDHFLRADRRHNTQRPNASRHPELDLGSPVIEGIAGQARNDGYCNDGGIDAGCVIGAEVYNKIVLCPLMIDFGRKNIQGSAFYNLTPKTPIAAQVSDLFYAIRTYCRFDVEIENNKMRLQPVEGWADRKHEKLFEIYPFMGIDTRNYDTKRELIALLDKYFKAFNGEETAEERRGCLFEKMGLLDSNLYRDRQNLTADDRESLRKRHIAADYQYAFAGIKVYPQLGFDPYPDDADERDKVNCLYEYCIEKRIPVTTHCGDSGYKPEDNNHLTSPLERWAKVLNDYPLLTLNFAHFGSQTERKKTQWRDGIIELTAKYDNVYTDISCKPAAYYTELKKLIAAYPRLRERVLYGSDFSINLLVTDTECYNDNLEAFLNSELEPACKVSLSEGNPERFLFGGKEYKKQSSIKLEVAPDTNKG